MFAITPLAIRVLITSIGLVSIAAARSRTDKLPGNSMLFISFVSSLIACSSFPDSPLFFLIQLILQPPLVHLPS